MNTSPISSARPISGAREQALNAPAPKAAAPAAAAAAGQSAVALESLEGAKSPPIDGERVKLIRKAIEQGTYPIVPAKIADAMIAAGILLRTPK
jgi:negative regulator of flagellin synthesis FlgM